MRDETERDDWDGLADEAPLSAADIAQMQASALVRVVDDDASVRDALQLVLEIEGWQVATYASAEDYLRLETPSQPGVVVMDVRMPGKSGLEAQLEMVKREWGLPLIFLTGHGEVDMAVMALKRGAVDFLQKPLNNERFLQAVAHAVKVSLTHERLKGAALTVATQPKATLQDRWATLTEKEKAVVRLIAQGLTNKQTAERLGNAVRTVEVHRANAYRKLDVKTLEELEGLLTALGL